MIYLLPEYESRTMLLATAVSAALTSYAGSVIWLYERTGVGRGFLAAVALLNLWGAAMAIPAPSRSLLALADTFTSGMLLGTTVAAMLLGHWYLNTPTMKLGPLQRLIILMTVAVVLRAIVEAAAWGYLEFGAMPPSTRYALLALRWLAGIGGVLALAAMSWQTLRIPNTQSATGILYVAVIFAFLGELTSQLLFLPPPHLVS
jgi:hypothetical protein